MSSLKFMVHCKCKGPWLTDRRNMYSVLRSARAGCAEVLGVPTSAFAATSTTAALLQIAAWSNRQSTVLKVTYLILHPGLELYPQQSLKQYPSIQGFGRMQKCLTNTFTQSLSLIQDHTFEAGCLPNVWANAGSQVVLLSQCGKT